MKFNLAKAVLIQLLFLISVVTATYANDYPHTDGNNIQCMDCHDIHSGFASLLRVDAGHVPQNIDDTLANNLCWSCHNDVIAPFMKTHSSLNIDDGYGDWSIECKTCHNPHQQRQVRGYGTEAFLASGIITAATTSSITSADTVWTIDEFAGLVVVINQEELVGNRGPNVRSYRILSNTEDTLSISLGHSGLGVDLTLVTPGVTTYAVIYGKLFRDQVARPDRGQPIDGDYVANGANGDTCSVVGNEFLCGNTIPTDAKFLRDFRKQYSGNDADNEHAFAGDLDADGQFQGPCEICHTRTRHHRNNDNWPAKADHTHNVGIKCTFCHKHVNGFLPLGAGAHEVHLTEEFGPKITCADGNWGCHGTNIPGSNYPNEVLFSDDQPLCTGRPSADCPNTGPDSGTQVCANCHGEGGQLAKYYFFRPGSSKGEAGVWVTPQSGEYTWNDTWLGELGEEKFCASCHNDSANPGPVTGPVGPSDPPNIVGDMDLDTGTSSYGFFANGHGKQTGNYQRLSWQDDAAMGNPAANRVCSDCHDYTTTHWNNSNTEEKRLKEGYENDQNNTVCRKCHNNEGGPVFANLGPEWYRTDSYVDHFQNSAHGPGNPGADGQPKGNLKCSQCHDPHGVKDPKILTSGSASAAMTRGNQQELCYRCHSDHGDIMQVKNDQIANNRPGGYVSADDIEEAFTLGDGHDLGTAFTNSGKNYTLECVSCHNVHVVTGKYWDAEQNLSPITLPLGGIEVFGDDPNEKMDYYAATGGSGTGGFYKKLAEGYPLGSGGLPFDQGAYYQPPKSGSGLDGFEFAGDVLPAYPVFCLTCHTERVSAANPPVNWGQGIGCTDNSVDPPNQRVECGARHGFGIAGTPYNMNETNPLVSSFWGNGGSSDALFKMNEVSRGRGGGHFMRWPYDSAMRNAGANFVLSCTDCHEAHRANRSSMIRERFQVNENGDCGTGGDALPNGENCSDGGLWNNFCNACHYYFGGHHEGMSCGNASCHEVNSIHRIIHSGADSGSGTQLHLTERVDKNLYIPPDFTPEIQSVIAHIGSDQLNVTFRESEFGSGTGGIFGAIDESDLAVDTLSGALQPGDFWLTDKGGNNPRTITAVDHTPGSATAVLTMSQPTTLADLSTDLLAAQPLSIWGWYRGGYNNWSYTPNALPAQLVSAGPWPTAVTGPPPFNIQGLLYGGLEMRLNGLVENSNQLFVSFAEGAYANSNGSGNLQASDFILNCGGRTIFSVVHTAGESSAIIIASSIVNESEVGVCTVAAAPNAIFDAYGNTAGTDTIALAMPPEAQVNDLVLNWDFNESSGSTVNNVGALGTTEDMHGVLTRNVTRVTTNTKPGASAGDNAVNLDRVSDRGAVQLNYTINPDDGFPPATYRSGGAPVIVQEVQQTNDFSFSVWVKPTALGCTAGQDLGLNTTLRRDILTSQFWVKNWALGIMRFSDDGDHLNGNCTTEDSTHDVLRFWVAVGDPDDQRCDPWGSTMPETVFPVNPAANIQGTWKNTTCGDASFPLPTNAKAHSFAQTETTASGASVTLKPGIWQHIVGTWDGRYIRIYIDSQLAAETDMGGSGNYIMLADPHLWAGDLIGDGSILRHVSSGFGVGARPTWSGSGAPSNGAVYWNTNGFYDLNSATYVGELDDVKFWKSALPLSIIQN